jgi:LPXTG-site transpeptidase (sortase) family protein
MRMNAMFRSYLAATLFVVGFAFASLSFIRIGSPARVPEPVFPAAIVLPTPAPLAVAQGLQASSQRASITRLEVPRIGINAPVITLGVDAKGAMKSPKGPTEVAYYDFSGEPGHTGNVVMSGHVDYIDYGPAVFWRLRDLKVGDEIRLFLDTGATIVYRVVGSAYYDENTAPVADIIRQTTEETITLITCGGSFDRDRLEYDQRLVVRGIRV